MFSRREEPPIRIIEKLKLFGAVHWRGVVSLVVPIICIVVLLPFPPEKHQWTAYCLCVMAVFWMTECIPLPVTSFLPVIVLPLAGAIGTTKICVSYFNDTIFMFIGSLMLAYSVEQSGLHKRLAYCMIRLIGYSHIKLLLAVCICTTFVSMWITNTAAATMMVPINFAVLKVFEDQKMLKVYDTVDGEQVASDITTCYFCAATFSATIGGIGTLVGTVTNLVFKGLFIEKFPTAKEYITFPLFSAFTIPVMVLLEVFMFLYLIIVYFGFLRPNSKAAKSAKITPEAKKAAQNAVNADWVRLGKLSFWEIIVIILFGGAMILFFCRSPEMFEGWADLILKGFEISDKKFIRDSALAAIVLYLMFLLPNNLNFFKNCTAKYEEDLPKSRLAAVLHYRKLMSEMPYSFTFLLGGGFALSKASDETGLNEKIGTALSSLSNSPNYVNLFIIILVTVLITNLASNVAVCNVIAPIAMQLGKNTSQNPLWYCLAAGIASSFCFMLPVGTPGNLIVQSAAKIPTKKMMKAGFGPTITTILIFWFMLYVYAPLIWSDLNEFPAWAK